jgi:hypothetical protein
MFRKCIVSSVLLIAFVATVSAQNEDRIYGRVTTVDDDVYEGLIRWDKNEGSWVDLLNGTKEIPRKYIRDAKRKLGRSSERGSKVELFGFTVFQSGIGHWGSSAKSGIRFGHIKSLEVTGNDEALLMLKSGMEVELSGGSTDLGTGIREIVIEDRDEDEIELDWDDIEMIEFTEADRHVETRFGDRLYGTLVTRRGDSYTGYVCWDVDEIFGRDVLDGEERGRDREVRFEKIAAIERYSARAAKIFLKSGDEMVLRGTNDVNSENRGIIISDLGFGQVTVEWDDFERLDFAESRGHVRYKDFDGGHELYGTVYTEDDEKYTGKIRWDNDEEYSWELLDGNYRDTEFEVEFGLIKQIEKKSYRSCIVTVLDGRTFRLRGSNDVDEDNKGIFIELDDGDDVAVTWEDFDRVEFSRQ